MVVNFQTQFIDSKRKLWRENQWKPIILVKVIPFSRNHSFQWKPFCLLENIFLVEAITFKGSCCS